MTQSEFLSKLSALKSSKIKSKRCPSGRRRFIARNIGQVEFEPDPASGQGVTEKREKFRISALETL